MPNTRQARALALRKRGRLYREIAAELGVSRVRARQLVGTAEWKLGQLEAYRAGRHGGTS